MRRKWNCFPGTVDAGNTRPATAIASGSPSGITTSIVGAPLSGTRTRAGFAKSHAALTSSRSSCTSTNSIPSGNAPVSTSASTEMRKASVGRLAGFVTSNGRYGGVAGVRFCTCTGTGRFVNENAPDVDVSAAAWFSR
jgi:hypothetical protein